MTDLTENTPEEPMEIFLSLDSKGLHIVAPSVAEKLAKKKLSPSAITALAQCPAKWLGENFVVRDLVEEEPDNAARRGSLFHKVMELVFAEAPEARTPALVKEKLKEVFASDEFKDLQDNENVIAWARDAINGYYSMGGRPERVQVATIAKEGEEPRLGLEVFVKGKLGDTKRDILGYIDRVVIDQTAPEGEEALVVEDWKTGAKAKKWNPKTKGDDGLAEARQQVIYVMLLEAMGFTVSAARLLFPVAGTVVDVDITDPAFRARVIKDIEDTDKALDVYTENNTFEFRPSFLCSWCPLAKICPSVQTSFNEKARTAYRSQPKPELLVKRIALLD